MYKNSKFWFWIFENSKQKNLPPFFKTLYASEILFATNISPTRIGKDVSYDECKKILKESKKILSKAIKAGGTTLNDYFNAESKPGYFKIQLKVYGRDGEKCKSCETNISKITQNNRSTYFCKESQN